MGYDDLDRALLDAWERAYQRFRNDPEQLERIVKRFSGPTYTRPLRSWALVLRANDKRIPDDNAQGVVQLDALRVRTWCAPVVIDYPGVPIDEAARLFGVNRTTVARWASPEKRTWWQAVKEQMAGLGDDARFGRPAVYRVTGRRLMLEHDLNRANPKRSVTRVWTPGYHGLDPGGEVWSGPWGQARRGLIQKVPADLTQQLVRVDRRLGGDGPDGSAGRVACRVMLWVCPAQSGGCGRRVYKLYLPMPAWTLVEAIGGGAGRRPMDAEDAAFVCQRCAGLVYESSERRSSPGKGPSGQRRRVDVFARFIRRVSGGALSASACRGSKPGSGSV